MADDSLNASLAFAPAPDAQKLLRFSKRLPVQRCRRILGRCLDLTPAEIVHRLGIIMRRDEPQRSVGTSSLAPTRAAVIATLAEHGMLGTSAASARDRRGAGPDRPALARIAEVGQRARAEVVVFGRTFALDAATVAWQRDPLTGRHLWADAALTEATAVQATREADGVALTDVKYVWELSRHQPLAALAFAARADADGDDATRVTTLLDSWMAQNPPGRGVNWASALEVGVRSISWLWMMAALLDDPAVSDAFAERWLRSLTDHYDFLRAHLSIFTDRSNHLIGEATALWMLATVVPGLTDAAAERDRALGVLATEIERQVSSDGVSREQAVGYQCFVLDFYLQVLALARRRDLALPAIIESRVAAMVDFLDRLLGSGGALPQIGDGDDGVGMPLLCVLDARDRAETLVAIAARLFDRSEWVPSNATARDMASVVLAVPAIAAPTERRRPARESAVLRDGGYCFLEAATQDGRARQLVFDVGHLGHMPNAAHEHADALNVLVRVDETLVVGDPGTGTYTASATIRNAFRGTAAHNTVTVDDLDQADVLDTFKWINMTDTRLLAWNPGPNLDYVAASHDGYARLRRPVDHTREILFARPDYWIVADHLTGHGAHRFTRRFHFPPDIRVTRRDERTFDAVAEHGGGDGLRFTFFDAPSSGRDGTRIEPGPWSDGYGQWRTSTRLATETGEVANATLLALITPLRGGQAEVIVDFADATAERDSQEVVLCRITPPSATDSRMDLLMTSPNAYVFVRRDAHGEHRVTLGAHRSRL